MKKNDQKAPESCKNFNISNMGYFYPDKGGHSLWILPDNCNWSVQRHLHKLHAYGNHGCRWCIHRYLNNTGSKKQKKMNFSFFFHCADQWPFRVNNGLQSLLLKCLTCSIFLVDGCCKIANEALAPPPLFPKERQLWRVSRSSAFFS